MLEILLISAGAVLETLFIMRSYKRRGVSSVVLKTMASVVFVLLGLVHCGYKKIRQKAPSPIGMILLSAVLGIVFWH